MSKKKSRALLANNRNRPAAIAATVAAMLVIYLVIRVTASGLNPAIAMTLPPTDPSALAAALPYAVADPRKRISPDLLVQSRRTALSAPLDFEPFFVQAKAEEQAGRLDNAIRLMEEARRRRPAFDLTRVNLIAYYQQARRYPELLTEIDFILRRNEQAAQIILPELAKLMTDPQGRAALATILARQPAWRTQFFEVAASQPGRPSDALALLELARSRNQGGNVALERGLYLRRLVQAGEHGRARSIWLQSLPPGERAENALLFNGGFARISAPEPFGWTIHQEAQGRAEIVTAGAVTPYLDVVYFGGRTVILAEQQLALPEGRYRLSQLARSDQQPSSGQLYWRLTCLGTDNEVTRLAVARLQPRFTRTGVEFTVPGGCAGQRLALIGEPGDISAEIRVQLTGLELARAN